MATDTATATATKKAKRKTKPLLFPNTVPADSPSMFCSLFKRRLTSSSLFPDGMDMHTHILWGVDDGAACLQDSLGIIRQLKSMGLKGAYCTPHIMARYSSNTPETLTEHFQQLLTDTRDEDFLLKLAAEYMLDEQFEAHLTAATPPLTYDGTHLLVELPQYFLPSGWLDMLLLAKDKGYTPVLAHPERYGRILQEPELMELAERGIKFQGNAGSLAGLYGKTVEQTAKKLYAAKHYTWWGSDTHSPTMAGKMRLSA